MFAASGWPVLLQYCLIVYIERTHSKPPCRSVVVGPVERSWRSTGPFCFTLGFDWQRFPREAAEPSGLVGQIVGFSCDPF